MSVLFWLSVASPVVLLLANSRRLSRVTLICVFVISAVPLYVARLLDLGHSEASLDGAMKTKLSEVGHGRRSTCTPSKRRQCRLIGDPSCVCPHRFRPQIDQLASIIRWVDEKVDCGVCATKAASGRNEGVLAFLLSEPVIGHMATHGWISYLAETSRNTLQDPKDQLM
jgi:hypothetical protein